MHKIFIDGAEGTTGLRLSDRLAARADIELLAIDPALRKDPQARLALMLEADVSFLCLPDEGAVEIVSLIDELIEKEGPASGYAGIRLVDCSTAHRTLPAWTYGLPEIAPEGTPWTELTRVANPGCHATGFIVAVRPLAEAGLISPDRAIAFHSLTGYSGGGKKLIADYEDSAARAATERDLLLAPRQYGLGQAHKHLPEMTAYSGLDVDPTFAPIVADYYCGMLVSVPLTESAEGVVLTAQRVYEVLANYYAGKELIAVRPPGSDPEMGFLSAAEPADRDDLEIFVFGKDGSAGSPPRLTVVTRFDNLGKGASGAAIQNMNLMLGLPECEGLVY
jgi:N-acetyl-gamma-glutamyl-phosphate reductase